jgi:hypothetical protein
MMKVLKFFKLLTSLFLVLNFQLYASECLSRNNELLSTQIGTLTEGLCSTCQCIQKSFPDPSIESVGELFSGFLDHQLKSRFESSALPRFVSDLKKFGHLSTKCSLDNLPLQLCPELAGENGPLTRLSNLLLNKEKVGCLPLNVAEGLMESRAEHSIIMYESIDGAANNDTSSQEFKKLLESSCESFYHGIVHLYCSERPIGPSTTNIQLIEPYAKSYFQNNPSSVTAGSIDLSYQRMACFVADEKVNEHIDEDIVFKDFLNIFLDRDAGNYLAQHIEPQIAPLCGLFECASLDEGIDLNYYSPPDQCTERRSPPRTLEQVLAELPCDGPDADPFCEEPLIVRLRALNPQDFAPALAFDTSVLPEGEFELEAARAHLRSVGVSEQELTILGSVGVRMAFNQDIGREFVPVERAPLTAAEIEGQRVSQELQQKQHQESARVAQEQLASSQQERRQSARVRNEARSAGARPARGTQHAAPERHSPSYETPGFSHSFNSGSFSAANARTEKDVNFDQTLNTLRETLDEARALHERRPSRTNQERINQLEEQVRNLEAEQQRTAQASDPSRTGVAPATRIAPGPAATHNDGPIAELPHGESAVERAARVAREAGESSTGSRSASRAPASVGAEGESLVNEGQALSAPVAIGLDELSRAQVGQAILVKIEGDNGVVTVELEPFVEGGEVRYRLGSLDLDLDSRQLIGLREHPFIQQYLRLEDRERLNHMGRTPAARHHELGELIDHL